MKRKEMLKEVYILQLMFASVDRDLNAFEQAEDLIESGGCSMIWVRSLKKLSDNIYILSWYFHVLCSDCT